MREIWVTSDTHFGHAEVIKYAQRLFSSVEEMNETLVANWNSVIKPNDRVYHLGDVHFLNQTKAEEILSRLNGRKVLILGNHDDLGDGALLRHFERVEMWRARGDLGLVLTHVPLRRETFPGRCIKNVHGHIHAKPAPSEDHVCVCVEQTGYWPVNIEDLRP